jgi:hypothetical protein
MKAGIRIALTLALALAAIAGATAQAGASGEAGQVATKSKCQLTLQTARSTYASYITKLSVRNTSCSKGLKVVRAYHECRKAHGGRDGHCKSKVDGYKCDEGKREGVPHVQYDARVVCKKGAKKVTHSYTMNL